MENGQEGHHMAVRAVHRAWHTHLGNPVTFYPLIMALMGEITLS